MADELSVTDTVALEELISEIESADQYWDFRLRIREFNEAIATVMWGQPVPKWESDDRRVLYWDCQNGTYRAVAPNFVESLDAAIMVYRERPAVIPSEPRLAVIEALRKRLAE